MNIEIDQAEEVTEGWNLQMDEGSQSLDLDRSVEVLSKWEWFNSKNLRAILESLRKQITTQADPHKQQLFSKLRHYALSSDFDSCRCPVTYSCKGELVNSSFVGRIYGYTTSLHHQNIKRFASLQSFPKWVRSGLASDFYWDLDIVNAHASILLGIFHLKDVRFCVNLEFAVKNREEVLKFIQTRFNLPMASYRDQGKNLLNILFYGGSINCWQQINPDAIDQNLNCEFFSLHDFQKEVCELKNRLWEVDSFIDICPFIPEIKARVQQKYPNDIRKQRNSFTSLLLQTEERNIMKIVEFALQAHEREMDVCIHDGGLVRKMVKKKHGTPTDQWMPFDPLQFNIKTDLSIYEWENRFPSRIIESCEDKIIGSHSQYRFVRLAVKDFASNWRENLVKISPNSPFRKTYQELQYFYEQQMTLCFIASEREYHLAGRFYNEEQLRHLLPEPYFINVMKDDHVKVLADEEEDQEDIIQDNGPGKNGIVNKQNFWTRYCSDQEKLRYDRILFCEEELLCANMKDPLTKFNPLNIKSKYLILFTGIESFNVMRQEHAMEITPPPESPLESIPDTQIRNSKENWMEMDFSEKKVEPENVLVSREPLFPLDMVSLRHKLDDDTIMKAACCINHFYLLFNQKLEELKFVLKFFAKIVQQPKKLDEACGLILYSREEGVGKSFAAGMLVDLFSPFARETHDTKDVFGTFGNMQENCLLLHLEDADAAEMKFFGAFFKNRLTARTITVERKHKDKVTRLNLCRFLVTTNTLDIFPIGENDRRYTVLQCSTILINQKEYFKTLSKQWSEISTKRAVLLFLNAIDLKSFSVEKDKPKTTPYKIMLSKSVSTEKKFVLGLCLWLNAQEHSESQQASGLLNQFSSTYQTKVTLLISNDTLWLRSQKLYDLFLKWIALESMSISSPKRTSTLPGFCKVIRELTPEYSSTKKDVQGQSCLPICLPKMLLEAFNLGFNEVDDALPAERLIIPTQPPSLQLQNLPLLKNRKQIVHPQMQSKPILPV